MGSILDNKQHPDCAAETVSDLRMYAETVSDLRIWNQQFLLATASRAVHVVLSSW